MKIEKHQVLEKLFEEIRKQGTINSFCKKHGFNKTAFSRAESKGSMSLERFLEILPFIGKTPAEFFADMQNISIMDVASEELYHELMACRLKVKRLEAKVQELETK